MFKHDLMTHAFTSSDSLFLDTNVWLFLEGGIEFQKNKVFKKYSSGCLKAIASQCIFYTSVIVISEIINVMISTEFKKINTDHKRKYGKIKYSERKDFRNSSDFLVVLSEVKRVISSIEKRCKLIDTSWNHISLSNILLEFSTSPSDFNDLIIKEDCIHHGFWLVTHDGDFQGCGANILSCNPKALL